MKIIQILSLAITVSFLAPTSSQAKYLDDETDLVYYGYRYYNPSTGRWLSKDPINELSFFQDYLKSLNISGGIGLQSPGHAGNELAFLHNDAVDTYDINGLFAPAAGCAIRVAIGLAATPADAVILSVTVSAGVVYVTYQVCKVASCALFCSDRHPTWMTCRSDAITDPAAAVLRDAPTIQGWSGPYVDSVKDDPAGASNCPGGAPGTRHYVIIKYVSQLPTGKFNIYTMSLSVNCCKCCNTYTSGTSCEVVHSGRGSGQQPYPDPIN